MRDKIVSLFMIAVMSLCIMACGSDAGNFLIGKHNWKETKSETKKIGMGVDNIYGYVPNDTDYFHSEDALYKVRYEFDNATMDIYDDIYNNLVKELGNPYKHKADEDSARAEWSSDGIEIELRLSSERIRLSISCEKENSNEPPAEE